MIDWQDVVNPYYKEMIVILPDGGNATISFGGKYCEPGMIAVCIYGDLKIYPHTVRNFETLDECKAFADSILNKTFGTID